MNQSNYLTRSLADAQESKVLYRRDVPEPRTYYPGQFPGHPSGVLSLTAEGPRDIEPANGVVYRLYVGTEFAPNIDALARLIATYVTNATITATYGLWNGQLEHSTVVEIVTYGAVNLEPYVRLAQVLRRWFLQSSVLLTWAPINTLELTSTEGAA